MDPNYAVVERVLFYLLGGFAITLPGEWALCAYLLLTHLDLSVSQYGFSPTSTVGYENVIRVVVIPALLLYRLRRVPVGAEAWQGIRMAWALLAGYAGI